MTSETTPPTPFDPELGFVVLHQFFSSDEVAQVNAACTELLALPANKRRARDKPSGGTRHLAELDDRIGLIAETVARPDLLTIVGEILGKDTASPNEVAFRCPQPGYGYQRLHADSIAPSTTAIITLTDFTTNNGATRIVPGSHLRTDLRRLSGKLEDHPDEIFLTGPAGTAFVFSGHVLHSGTQNNSAQERPALHIVWRPS